MVYHKKRKIIKRFAKEDSISPDLEEKVAIFLNSREYQ